MRERLVRQEQVVNEKSRVIVSTVITAIAGFLVLIGILMNGKNLLETPFPSTIWFSRVSSMLFYSVLFGLFIFRCRPQDSLNHPLHWLVALLGSWLVLFLQQGGPPWPFMIWIALPVQIAGIAVSALAIAALGRSFGVFAAQRGIKTHGMYEKVRHPLYAGEALWFFSLVLQNLSVFNLGLFAAQMFFQYRRMLDEENFLRKDPEYEAYLQRVPYRLLPGIF